MNEFEKSVELLLLNRSYEVLLLNKEQDNHWKLPSYPLVSEENFSSEMVKNVLDNFGLVIRNADLRLLSIEGGQDEYSSVSNYCFIIHMHGEELRLNDENSTGFRFFDMDELPKNLDKSSSKMIGQYQMIKRSGENG